MVDRVRAPDSRLSADPTDAELDAVLARQPWRSATTMPRAPHEYVLQSRFDGTADDFRTVVAMVKARGVAGVHGGRTYRYLDLGHWRYWIMPGAYSPGLILNRARIPAADRVTP